MSLNWREMLELKLRRSSRTEFQKFHADFMSRIYPNDYIPVGAHGRVGDGGMDGYLRSTDTLYQCYGADNGKSLNIKNVLKKMRDDYDLAVANNPAMKEWVFVHNLIELPSPITKLIIQLGAESKTKKIEFGIFGPTKFRELLGEMSPDDLDDLIGIRSLSADDVERLPTAINGIINKIAEHYDNNIIVDLPIRPVPLEKMEFNRIPIRWRNTFNKWIVHAPIVEEIIANYPDDKVPEFAPLFLNESYKDLKLQGLSPQEILENLYEKLAGYVQEHNSRYEASLLVLASMFESCVIFEDKDKRTNPEN